MGVLVDNRMRSHKEGDMKVSIVERILSANDQIAADNRRVFDEKGVFVINLMASPGAGKTSLILRTIEALQGKLRLGVIEGDVASQVDADKVAETGVPVVQINTGGTCHLDAPMVRQALADLPLDEMDLLLVENVGNLICPTGFRLGEHARVMISSIPEGDDKPYKYPAMFTQVDALVVNKTDLLPYLDFDLDAFRQLVVGLNADVRFFEASCKTGEGVKEWAEWLQGRVERALSR
jgi:hydrogenase nickel incorporation protein HypB